MSAQFSCLPPPCRHTLPHYPAGRQRVTTPRQTGNFEPMLFCCWSTVCEADPTLKQHRSKVACFLETTPSSTPRFKEGRNRLCKSPTGIAHAGDGRTHGRTPEDKCVCSVHGGIEHSRLGIKGLIRHDPLVPMYAWSLTRHQSLPAVENLRCIC